MKNQFALLKDRRFWPLFVTQFLGAFNNNFYKTTLSVMVAYGVIESGMRPEILVSVAAGLFILPFILFTPLAGMITDKYSKDKIIRFLKLVEIFMMLAALGALWVGSVPLLLAVLFALGVQAAFFSPSKFSILPQHLQQDELIGANALVNTGTYLAILLGTILGGLLALSDFGVVIISVLLVVSAITGYLASRFVPAAPPVANDVKLQFNIPAQIIKTLRLIRAQQRGVCPAIIAAGWFFFIGALLIAQFPAYTKHVLGVDTLVMTLFMVTFSVGVGLGGLLNNRLLRSKIEATFVPLAAVAIGFFLIDLRAASDVYDGLPALLGPDELISLEAFLSYSTGWRIVLDLLGLSIAGGLYVVPLKAMIQDRTPPEIRARVVAGSALVDALFVLTSSLVAIGLFGLGLKVQDLFMLTGFASMAAAFYVFRNLARGLPEVFMRGKSMSRPLLVFAMKEESQEVFSDYDVLHTGIGKVNAAYGLTNYLKSKRPALVVNMGTAGSRKHKGGVIVNCTGFVQRDMDVTVLGFEKFQTPFSQDPVTIKYGRAIDTLPQGICGTGDNFDASEGAAAFDVVDMEAYALALICQRENIPFLCLKYVSDGADSNAHMDWKEALHQTAEKLRELIRSIQL